MNIKSIKYFPYELIFNNPFHTSHSKTTTRKIYFIKLTTDDDQHFYGECAPLPKFGSEDYYDVEQELKLLSEKSGLIFPADFETVPYFLKEHNLLPTVSCGVEQAIFEFLAAAKNPPEFLENNKVIPVNGIVDLLDQDGTLQAVNRLYEKGYTTIKLKTGRKNFIDDYNIVEELHDRFQGSILFRLDVNGKWTYEEAVENTEKLDRFGIQYIEQPVNNLSDLIKLANNTNLSLAADESMRTLNDAKEIINNSDIEYLVIKPMLIGGLFKTKEILDLAQKSNKKVIISSSLESNIGRRHLVSIAALADKNLAHGLGTSDLFVNDNSSDLFPVINGKISFDLSKHRKS